MTKISDLLNPDENASEKEALAGVYEPSDPSLFPSTPSNATEDLRLKMAKKGREDLYYLCKVILGYKKLRPEVHGALCRFLDTATYTRRMLLMPRSHYKTTISTIGQTIKDIINDPEIRILLVADTGANAERFMLEIGNHFKHNELFRWLYPEVIPENFKQVRWNTKEIVVKRKSPWKEPTVDAMGAGGGIESRHYEIIRADDLVTEKHIHSDTEMEKLIEWVGGMEPLLVNDVEGRIDYTGSRKKKGDLYEHIQSIYGGNDEPIDIGPYAKLKGRLALFSRSIIENGKLIFPWDAKKKSGVSWEYVRRMRTHDPERYHAQLANSPKGTGINVFRVEDLRYFRLTDKNIIEAIHDGKLLERVSVWNLQRIVLYDPAVSERKGSSKQAIIVCAKGSGPFRYILETHIGHFAPDQAIKILLDMDKKWNPDFHSIESRAFQGSIKYWLYEKTSREGIPMPAIQEYPPKGSSRAIMSKDYHIRGLQPVVSNNLLWVQDDQIDLIDNIEFYPNVRWKDPLDCLAQGLEYWPFSVDEAAIAASKKGEREYLQRAFGPDFRLDKDEKTFSEAEWLAQFDPTGYGRVILSQN